MLDKLSYDPLSIICGFFTPDEMGELRTLSKGLNVSIKKYSNRYWYKIYKQLFPEDVNYISHYDYRSCCMHWAESIIPILIERKGCDTVFRYDKKFFRQYKQQCLKVVAVYTLILFGANEKNKYHIVEYNPHKGVGEYVGINKMLLSAFYNLPCDSSFFHLSKLCFDFGEKSDFKEEKISSFKKSVDRTFMEWRFGKTVGMNFMNKVRGFCVCDEIHHFEKCKCDTDEIYKEDINKMLQSGTFYNTMKQVKMTQYLPGSCNENCLVGCSKKSWSDLDMDPDYVGVKRTFNNLIFDFANYDLEMAEIDGEYLFKIGGIKRGDFHHAAVSYNYYIGHRDKKEIDKVYYEGANYLDEIWVKVKEKKGLGVEVTSSFVGIEGL